MSAMKNKRESILMAWNEPGNNKDPWGDDRKRSGTDGPPDLDEILKNTFGRLFGKGKGGGGGSGSGSDGGSNYIVYLVLALLVAFYLFRGAGIVNEQERAVVLRFGEYVETKMPGFRWNPPFIDKVFTENVTRVRIWSTSEQMLTKDLNIVDVVVSVQYSIESAEDFILNVKNPEDSLQQAANSALRHVVGSTAMHEVLTEGRSQVAADIQSRLQEYLDAYTTGIQVEKVNVEDSKPPNQVQSAFDDVIRAREDEERYKNEAQAYANSIIPDARGRAQRMVEEATAYRDQVVARAEGESDRFEMLLTEYTKAPEVTRQRLYMESMEQVLGTASKVLIDVEDGNNMLYLPLDKLVEAGKQATTARAVTTPADLDELASRIANKVLEEAANASNARRREGR